MPDNIAAEKVKPYHNDNRNKGEQVRSMFDSIAPAYDFMNKLMTLGIDKSWRKKAVAMIKQHRQNIRGEYKILDVATGTADLAIQLAHANKNSHITGIDLSDEMIEIGQKKIEKHHLEKVISLTQGDCLSLPFADETFDCVSVAFGVRNFEHLADGYKEMLRVTRKGGMLCVIELSTPASPIIKPLYNLYTRHIIPVVGRFASKDVSAYSYLPASIAAVPQRSEMTQLIENCGYNKARFKSLTFGVCTIYTAFKG